MPDCMLRALRGLTSAAHHLSIPVCCAQCRVTEPLSMRPIHHPALHLPCQTEGRARGILLAWVAGKL